MIGYNFPSMEHYNYVNHYETTLIPNSYVDSDKISYKDFAKRVKKKYPWFKEISDLDLVLGIVNQYPEYKYEVNINPNPPVTTILFPDRHENEWIEKMVFNKTERVVYSQEEYEIQSKYGYISTKEYFNLKNAFLFGGLSLCVLLAIFFFPFLMSIDIKHNPIFETK